MKSILTLFLFFFIATLARADIKPEPGAILNYTQVMLEYDAIDGATEYVVEVSSGLLKDEKPEMVTVKNDNSTATLIDNLKFGGDYVWRYAGIIDGKQTDWKGRYNFSISSDSTIGLEKERFKVAVNNKEKGKQGLIAVGNTKTIIDKSGIPVWYMPKIDKKIFIKQSEIAEFRMSAIGTILLYSSNGFGNAVSLVCETDLQGNILWRAPNDGQVSGDSSEYYHHDFKRLSNGNYIVLGCKYGWRKVPKDVDVKNIRKVNIDSTGNPWRIKYLFNTIIEYNKAGKVVWSWDLNDHVTDKELFATGVVTDAVRRELPARAELFGHMNSFDVDSENKYIYANFRETHEIVKIQKSTGNIVHRYKGKLGVSHKSKEINFQGQHDVNIFSNGNLAVFDNGDALDTTIVSRAIEFSQTEGSKPGKIVWSFSCKMDETNSGKTNRYGGIEDIGDGHRMISMGGLNRIVEVDSKDNSVLWDCTHLIRRDVGSKSMNLYRVHFTPSLYPCYFTAQWGGKNEKGGRDLRVFNEGSAADSYVLNAYSSKGDLVKSVPLGTIEAGKDLTTDLQKAGLSGMEKDMKFEVMSVKNRDFKRSVN